MLADGEIERFVEDGYVVVRGAVPGDVLDDCRRQIDAALRARGVEPDDPASWRDPVVRLPCPESPAFAAAGSQPVLWSIYDQLLGAGTWWRRRGVGGTIPVRFPSSTDPGDAGWHIDGSFERDGVYWVNVRSGARGLLALFLFSDIGDADAPTEVKVGSHLDVPPLLDPYGDSGMSFLDVAQRFPASTFDRQSVFVTGKAGDVFVCHPFLVHRATWPHRGTRPRAIAQPGVATPQPFALGETATCPVEQAILTALGR